jgi:hypothetical protein
MSEGLCAAPGCALAAWRACEQCHRPFCLTHARFVPRKAERGFGRSLVIEFEFVCLECQPDSADEDAWEDWQRGTGTGDVK